MKYCPHCGAELIENARFCQSCGCPISVENTKYQRSGNVTLQTVAKIFMVISTVLCGLALIPLCWMVPMTVHYYKVTERGEKASAAFAVCTLLFVSFISGILMLVEDDM